MKINLPDKVRQVIYVIVVLGTAVLVPLEAANVIDTLVLTVWSSVSGAAALLAAFNVPSKSDE